MDHVGQEGSRSRKVDDDHLHDRRQSEADERDLQYPDATLVGLHGHVNLLMHIVRVREGVLKPAGDAATMVMVVMFIMMRAMITIAIVVVRVVVIVWILRAATACRITVESLPVDPSPITFRG